MSEHGPEKTEAAWELTAELWDKYRPQEFYDICEAHLKRAYDKGVRDAQELVEIAET